MGFKDKFNNLFNVSADEYYDDVDDDTPHTYDPEDYEQEDEMPHSEYSRAIDRGRERDEPRLVGLSSNSSCSHVVLKKLDRFDDVGEVADILNEKRIVILNLETCQSDVCRRVLDFLYGVAYANSGEIKRVAGRAYIITPQNVPLTGEMLDEIDDTTSMFR